MQNTINLTNGTTPDKLAPDEETRVFLLSRLEVILPTLPTDKLRLVYAFASKIHQ